jgi:hypothetical protein
VTYRYLGGYRGRFRGSTPLLDTFPLRLVLTVADTISLTFNQELFCKRALIYEPWIPTVEELCVGIISYFKKNHPELLKCKVKSVRHAAGHDILWTLPCTPDLQLIKIYWGLAKNWRSGNHHLFEQLEEDIDPLSGLLKINDRVISRKDPNDYCHLFQHSIDKVNRNIFQIVKVLMVSLVS